MSYVTLYACLRVRVHVYTLISVYDRIEKANTLQLNVNDFIG